jgi:hypothetical protein
MFLCIKLINLCGTIKQTNIGLPSPGPTVRTWEFPAHPCMPETS